jgi:hypothetical protein
MSSAKFDPHASQEMSPISDDEMLSQLAGNEIARLLAEVDQQLDSAVSGENHAPAPALALRRYPGATAAPALENSADQAAGLTELADQQRRDQRKVVVFAVDDGEQQALHDAPAHEPVEFVGTPVRVFEQGVQGAQMGHRDYFADLQAPVPAWLKPLAWINAPFEGMSIAALGALGKVAVGMFVSALATLAYVIVLTRA